MTRIRLDYANLLAPHVGEGGGPPPERLAGDLADRFQAAHRQVQTRRAAGQMGFFDLPDDARTADRVRALAGRVRGRYRDVVVLGIGGSGLGALALRDALLGPRWNEGGAAERGDVPRLHVADNPDPATFSVLLRRLDPGTTLFNVVSKSGSTAETMAQYLVARGWVESLLGADRAPDHFVFTTDPEVGALRRIAEEEGIAALPVPGNVGGRFSVLSSVGLFPAAACGVDVSGLLAGAADVVGRCGTDVLGANPAGVLAALLHAADAEFGRPVHVFMPYADRLRTVGLWFQQLWAESLGKSVDAGPTPVAAVGATDQHSLLQLLMEGPHDKVVLLVSAQHGGPDLEIPDLHREVPSLAYLGGKTLSGLLDAERRATTEALRRAGRPNATIVLDRVDEACVGALIMLLEIATVYAGALYGVDPLGQPGVEMGKRLTYGLMGRDGFERPDLDAGDPRWRV